MEWGLEGRCGESINRLAIAYFGVGIEWVMRGGDEWVLMRLNGTWRI